MTMINQKLICVDTKDIFSGKIDSGEISNSSIAFIKETGEIWTHGKYFGLSSTALEDYVTLDTNQTITGSKTISNLLINKPDENITPGSVFIRNSSDNKLRRISWSNFKDKLLYDIQSLSKVYDNNILWGKEHLSNAYSPVDAALVSFLRANRLACYNSDFIKTEKSTDNGVTWEDYEVLASVKSGIFTNGKFNISAPTPASVNNQLRITITRHNNIYCNFNKFIINYTSNGTSGGKVILEGAKISDPDNFITITTANMLGWSGWNVVQVSPKITFGGRDNHYGILRFTFSCTSVPSTERTFSILHISGIGEAYFVDNPYASDDTLGTLEYNGSVTFPSKITVESIVKSGGNASQLLRADGGVSTFNWTAKSTSPTYLWGGDSQYNYYIYKPSDLTVGKANQWATRRTITIGGKSNLVDGSTDITYTLDDIGAQKVLYDYVSGGEEYNTTTSGNLLNYCSEIGGWHFFDTKFFNHISSTAIRTQIAYGLYSDSIAMRRYNDSTWSEWKPVAFKDDIPDTSKFIVNYNKGGTDEYTTGYFKIHITSTNGWMLYFKVRLYQNYQYYDIDISGYNYLSIKQWLNPKAFLVSSSQQSIEVIFGKYADNDLWIAIPSDKWWGIGIFDVVNGYRQAQLDENLFEITHEEELTGTIQTTVTAYRSAKYDELSKYVTLSTSQSISGFKKFNSLEATSITAESIIKAGSSDNFILLGGGGQKALSELEYDIANYNTLGLIKPRKSYTAAATFSGNAVSSTSSPSISPITTTIGRYYAVEMDSNGVPFVNVPWSDTVTLNTDYKVSSGNTNVKIFLVGTTSQTSAAQNIGNVGYSNSSVFAYNGCLYSNGIKVKTITDNYIYSKDTRDEDGLPDVYKRGLSCDFKRRSLIEDKTSGYGVILTIKGWTEESGGLVYQLGFTPNGIRFRKSNETWTSWEEWKNLSMTGDFLPLSGGTLTGTLYTQYLYPRSSGVYNLGNSDHIWNFIHVKYVGTSENPVENIYAKTIRSFGHIYPYSSNSYDIGTTAFYYRDIYANGFKKKGSSDSYVLLGGGGHKALTELSTFNPKVQEFYSLVSPNPTNSDSYGIICDKTWGTTYFNFRSVFLIQGGFGSGILYIEMYGNNTNVYSANVQYSGSITKSMAGVQNINHYLKIYYNATNRNFRIYYNYYNNQAVRVSELYTVGSSLSIDDFSTPSSATNLPTSGYTEVHIDSLVESSMNITAPAFYESSDIKLKENVKPINNIDYSKLTNIDFKEFNFKKDPIKKYGVIAQDLEKVGLENLVKGEEGSKSVDYISLLILEVQRLRNEIENIKKQIPENTLNTKSS